MAEIIIDNITFFYETPYKMIFQDLNLRIDTMWKTGLIGRNGRGKTTLLNIIQKKLDVQKGRIINNIDCVYFPYQNFNPDADTFSVIKNAVAPYELMEKEMEELLSKNDEKSILRYMEVLNSYQAAGGYEIDSEILKEAQSIGIGAEILNRPFCTLSGGEKTRSLLISVFLKKGSYALIDEPTNHLDMKGREILGEYLKSKSGFLMISHDRYFLDLCVDHIITINKSQVEVMQGNYSDWEYNFTNRLKMEEKQNEKLTREIRSLQGASSLYRQLSGSKEKEKYKGSQSDTSMTDRGFVGAKSAKLAKQAVNFEKRISRNIEQKKELLTDTEKLYELKLLKEEKSPSAVLDIYDLSLKLGEKEILKNFSLSVKKGERIAITGRNGCGKTSLFNCITGEIDNYSGEIFFPKYIRIMRSYQVPRWQQGYLKDNIIRTGVDETVFRNVMGILGVSGDIFLKPLQEFSEGERKKIDLCRTLIEPSSLLLWDEPLNYLDIASRELLEQTILKFEPTILFIEHDRYFIENVAQRVIAF